MKKHFFRKIFLLYFLILLIAAVFIELYITGVVRTNYITDLTEKLSTQAILISDIVPAGADTKLDELCRSLKEKINARVTLLDAEGNVRGDSDHDSSALDNRLFRPEIQRALIKEPGWIVRLSDTKKEEMLYVARKVMHNDEVDGFVRLAIPLHEVKRSVNMLRVKINITVILIFLAAAAIIIWQTERIRKFVNQINDYAGALTHGLLKKRLFLEGAGEFSELAGNLNNMAMEMQENITKKDEEKNRLSVILRSIPDALLLVNTGGIIELSNRAAWELFGSQVLEGRHFIEVMRDPGFSSLIDTVRKNRQPCSAELVLNIPAEKYLTVSVSPLYYKVGELAGTVAIFHDTTQMKKLEQMRKDLVANVSHEIKTPVTAIKGFAETLLDGALYDSKNAERFLKTIHYHSERLNRLLDDLLTLSKVELGSIKMNKSEVGIPGVMDHVIETAVVHAAEKDIPLKLNIHPEIITISADRDRFEQILLNLVDNAVKFTERGEIEVGTEEEKGRKYFFVRDTGIGISHRYISRLGERFFRVETSRSRELGGTGLGLAIVKHIVKAHGWEMRIESEEGQGTVVKVYF